MNEKKKKAINLGNANFNYIKKKLKIFPKSKNEKVNLFQWRILISPVIIEIFEHFTSNTLS